MDGKTLEDYLCSWGLAMYVEKFKEQKIKDINMLQLLSQEDIKELIPILGHRVKLIAGIKQLKQIIDKAFPTEEQESTVNSTTGGARATLALLTPRVRIKFHFCSDVSHDKESHGYRHKTSIPLLVSGRLDANIAPAQSLRAAHLLS
ncbi:hypothetical protein EVAR_91861_1 [Eumeta japonica]|uniref:SAM domain-containing protein n=1 Tax=Eumeta variegata TaxID=151549 RepID=A0A4C2AAK6_EUMVA|nr:hypothetical protein EVAR_91861_1 [Eumeta japonica]